MIVTLLDADRVDFDDDDDTDDNVVALSLTVNVNVIVTPSDADVVANRYNQGHVEFAPDIVDTGQLSDTTGEISKQLQINNKPDQRPRPDNGDMSSS